VSADVPGVVEDRGREVLAGGVDHQLGPELPAQARLLGAAGGREHARAARGSELDGRGAEPARTRGDEERLAGGEAPAPEERQVRRVEGDDERRGLGVVEARRGLEHGPERCQRVFREPPVRELRDGDDAAPDPRLAAGARGVHRAAHIHAQREGGLHRDRGRAPVAAVEVVPVERAGRDPHAHLPRPRFGHGDFDHPAHLAGRSVSHDLQRPHPGLLPWLP
jgi:hypothetical protein